MSAQPVRPLTPPREGERGMALVTTMLFTMLMLMVATAILTNSTTETQMSANHVAQLQAFYASEAGLEQAKAWLSANRADTDLMNALLVESQNATPDQSSLTLPDATVVATPLGPQTFATGTYNVVISDNVDDADPLTDSDRRWIISSQGGGLANASALLEEEVLGNPLADTAGAVGTPGNNINLDFDQSGGGIGTRVPPAAITGMPHDLAGNPIAPGPGCLSVPPIASDSNNTTADYLTEFDTLRSNIVRRANGECDQFGAPACPPGMTGCCTPELWWVRGSAVAPRFDWQVPVSYNLLDLRSSELHATGADYSTITQPPTMILPTPLTAPFDGAVGNTAEPFVSQVAPQVMQDLLATVQTVIAAYPAGDTIIPPGNLNNSIVTYGSPTDPKLVIATSNLRIRNGSTFTGFGVLSVDRLLEIRDSTFNWTGIVLITGNQPELQTRSSTGQLVGSILFNATNGLPKFDMDKNSDSLAIKYSCAALDLAASAAPVQTLSWIALHR